MIQFYRDVAHAQQNKYVYVHTSVCVCMGIPLPCLRIVRSVITSKSIRHPTYAAAVNVALSLFRGTC